METANLVLKTMQISTSVDPAVYFGLTVTGGNGKISQNRTSMTWYNVNLRAILGELYDRYEKFNICLNFVGCSETGATNEQYEDYRIFQIKLSGLNFTSSNNGSVIASIIEIPLTANTTYSNTSLNPINFTFVKQEMVNITIDLITLYEQYYVPYNLDMMIGHCVFSFSLSGVEDYKNINKKEDRVDTTINRLNLGKLEKIYR
jgi:hypothetical protein